MEKKQDNKETFVERIKKVLARNDKIAIEIRKIKTDLDAKIESMITRIRENRVTSMTIEKSFLFGFTCSVDGIGNVQSFLKEYLHNEGFVKIEFQNQSDNRAKGHSGVVNFTIPD